MTSSFGNKRNNNATIIGHNCLFLVRTSGHCSFAVAGFFSRSRPIDLESCFAIKDQLQHCMLRHLYTAHQMLLTVMSAKRCVMLLCAVSKQAHVRSVAYLQWLSPPPSAAAAARRSAQSTGFTERLDFNYTTSHSKFRLSKRAQAASRHRRAAVHRAKLLPWSRHFASCVRHSTAGIDRDHC